MAAVIEALRVEHRNMARLLDALEHQVDVFADGGTPDYELIRGIAEYFVDYPDRCHHPKEDAVFERLRERCPPEAAALGDLPAEHRRTAERARRFRDAIDALLNEIDMPRDVVAGAAREFIDAERRHMLMEEDRFFRLAEGKLLPEDWSRIADRFRSVRDALSDARAEKEFRDIRERLLAWEREYGTG